MNIGKPHITGTLRKMIAVVAAVVFLLEQVCIAAPRSSRHNRSDTLSPTSRFKPLITVEENDAGRPRLNVAAEEETGILPEALSRENAEFMYLSVLISGFITRFGDMISAKGLSRVIREELPDLGTSGAYDLDKIFKDRDSYCVPYTSGDSGNMILRFYPGGSEFSGSVGEIVVSDEERGKKVYMLCETADQDARTVPAGEPAGASREATISREEEGRIARPFDTIEADRIHNVLVNAYPQTMGLDFTPKLGEFIINTWPIISGLFKKFPQAVIHVAGPYTELFEAKMFEGRIRGVDLEAVDTDEKRKAFLRREDIDLAVDVTAAPSLYRVEGEKNGAGRYSVYFPRVTGSGSALSPQMLMVPDDILYRDKSGAEYRVTGSEQALDAVTEPIPLRGGMDGFAKAGLWRLSILNCGRLGLEVDERDLARITPDTAETVGAIHWLEEQFNKDYPESWESFDPHRKIVVINPYAVTQEGLIERDEWVELVLNIMRNVDNAYFVFTHGGVMDRDFAFVEDIAEEVHRRMAGTALGNAIILPRVRRIYPHINNLLSIASAAVTLDIGFSHLSSGIYDVPTLIITHKDIMHWLPPRRDACTLVIPKLSLTELLYSGALSGGDILPSSFDLKTFREKEIERISGEFAEYVNTREERHSAIEAKTAALSSEGRVRMDRGLISEQLTFPEAAEAAAAFLRKIQAGLGLADIPLVPVIAFVDSAGQLGMKAPRFMAKLYSPADGDTVLMIDRQALITSPEGSVKVREDVIRNELVHEIFGHMLVRYIFPEFMHVQSRHFRTEDQKGIIVLKTIEEMLAVMAADFIRRRMFPAHEASGSGRSSGSGMISDLLDRGDGYGVWALLKRLLAGEEDVSRHRYFRAVRNHITELTSAMHKSYLPRMTEIFDPVNGRITLDGRTDKAPPALALENTEEGWRQVGLDPDQHRIINLAWRDMWPEGHELPGDDIIRKDIVRELGALAEIYPVHIHSPPEREFLERIKYLSREQGVIMPPGESFRLVTHPGTWRTAEGFPRSLNYLIPREQLEIIKRIRSGDPAAYRQWLSHEVLHIKDRAASKVGQERKEEEITAQEGLDRFIRLYNRLDRERSGKGPSPAVALIKDNGVWTQMTLSGQQHKVVNRTWEKLWQDGAYETDMRDPIRRDLEENLEGMVDDVPIHVHTPPDAEFYTTLYGTALEEGVYFPDADEFRFISHPGTFRHPVLPTSINLLIPDGEYEMLLDLRENDKEAYYEWLAHEITHLIDRYYKPRGEERTEAQITAESTLNRFLLTLNHGPVLSTDLSGIAQREKAPEDGKLRGVKNIHSMDRSRLMQAMDEIERLAGDEDFRGSEFHVNAAFDGLLNILDYPMDPALRKRASEVMVELVRHNPLPPERERALAEKAAQAWDTERFNVLKQTALHGTALSLEYRKEYCYELAFNLEREMAQVNHRAHIDLIRAIADHTIVDPGDRRNMEKLKELEVLLEGIVLRGQAVGELEHNRDKIKVTNTYAPMARVEAVRAIARLARFKARRYLPGGQELFEHVGPLFVQNIFLLAQIMALSPDNIFRGGAAFRLAMIGALRDLRNGYLVYLRQLGVRYSDADVAGYAAEFKNKFAGLILKMAESPVFMDYELSVKREVMALAADSMMPGINAGGLIPLLFSEDSAEEGSVVARAVKAIAESSDRRAREALRRIAAAPGDHGTMIRGFLLSQGYNSLVSVPGEGRGKGPSAEGPAVALVNVDGRWEQAPLMPDQHEVVNAAWSMLRNRENRLPGEHDVVKDLTNMMGEDARRLPVEVYSAPGDELYDLVYGLAEEKGVVLFPRDQFRLIAHPGTYREKTERPSPRAINLFIPAEDLDLLMMLRQENPDIYQEWLSHEAAHLIDRIYRARGEELSEAEVTYDYPVDGLIEEYNRYHIGSRKQQRGRSRRKGSYIVALIKAMSDPDGYTRGRAAVELVRAIETGAYEKDEVAFLRACAPALAGVMPEAEPAVQARIAGALFTIAGMMPVGEQAETALLDLISAGDPGLNDLPGAESMVSGELRLSEFFYENAARGLMDRLRFASSPGEQKTIISTLAGFYTRDLVPADLDADIYGLLKGVASEGDIIFVMHKGLRIHRKRVPVTTEARIEAMDRIVELTGDRVDRDPAVLTGSEDMDLAVAERYIRRTFRDVYAAMLNILGESDKDEKATVAVRIAAAESLDRLTGSRIRALLSLYGNRAGDEREYRRLEESVQLVREKLLLDVARLSLGIDPPEKSLAVRVELMRALVRHYQQEDGLRKRDLLVPTLFDTTAEDVERGYEEYARLREEFQALVIRAILLSNDSRSRDILELLAERSRTEVGDLIRRHLGEENTITEAGGSGTFTEESRGYEGLPNEQYTPGLAEAIDTGSFVAARWDGRALKRTSLEHEQLGRIPPGEQKYGDRDVARAEKAVKGLRPEEQAMLEGMIIVFFEGERSGHYSLSRPQLYVNVNFLEAPEALKKILRHELLERAFIVSRLEAAREKGRLGMERGEDTELLAAALGKLKHQHLEYEENQTGIAPGEEYRKVSSTGQISLHKGQYSVGQFLAGETVRGRPSLKGSSGVLFDVFYGAVRIGTVRSDREQIEYTDIWRQWRKKLDIRIIRKKAGIQRTVLPSGQITFLDRHFTVGAFLRGDQVRIDVEDPAARDPGFSVFYGNIKVGTRAPGENRITFTDGWKAIREENDGRRRKKSRTGDGAEAAPDREAETPEPAPYTGPFELERVIKGGLFVLKQLRYTGPTRTVPGGGRLVTGNSYILKVSRLDEHIGDIRREEDIQYFLEPTMRFYREVNPDNTSSYLPRIIGTAEECGLEGLTDGRVPLFEFVEGKNLRDYLKQLRLYSVRDREVRFLRVVAEMIKGYKEIYFDNEFVHGDIDSTAMVIKTRKGRIGRFCFVDNDSAARFNGPDDVDRIRMTAHKKEFSSQDRQERLKLGPYSKGTELCAPRDDVFSLCTLLINESRGLYSRGQEVPSEWMRQLRGLLSEYRQYSGLAVTKEGLAEDFLEDITDFVARQLETIERKDEKFFTEGLDYMDWLQEGILSDDRSLDVMPADPRDAARIEDLSRNIFADRGRPELTQDVVRQAAGVLREFKKIFVWFRIGGPQGYISIDIERTEGGDEQAYIAGIAVDPDHREEGAAKMLIARAVDELFRERGIRNFCARVERDNTASRSLFKKMGFSGAELKDDRGMLFYVLCLDENGKWISPKTVNSADRSSAPRTEETGDNSREADARLEPYDGERSPAVYLKWLDTVESLFPKHAQIRPVLTEDLGEIIHISRAGNSPSDIAEDLEQAVMNEGRDKREVYVREYKGSIAGYVYFHYDNREDVTIEDIGVLENARSEYTMNMLLARVLKESVEGGTLGAIARVPEDRVDIKSLVERFGFSPGDSSPPAEGHEGNIPYRLSLYGEDHDRSFAEVPDISYRARRKVRDFIDSLLIRAYHATSPGQKVLLGIDSSWVPEMQTEFQALLSELTRISRKKGFGDMIIVRERGSALGGLLRDTAEKEGIPYSNIIVLAAEDIARGDAFDPLRSSETETRAFIAGVDASRISGDCYIDLLGMVKAALDLEGGLAGAADVPDIEMVRTGPRTWLFIPDAVRYDHFRRKQMYAAEKDLITSA